MPTSNGVSYAVPNSKYVPLVICKKLLDEDVSYHETGFNKILSSYKYEMPQTQYDACIFARYLCYRLGSEIDELLKSGNRDKTAWENAINKLPMSDKRKADAINLFCNGIYNPDSKGC